MDDVDDKFESPWYAQRIHDLSLEGWVVDSIEAYLEEDVELASERIVYVDFAVDLAQELLERTGYLGESVNARSMEQSDVWERELRDPMNAERVLDEYNAWAKEWRPWELELNRGLLAWRAYEFHCNLRRVRWWWRMGTFPNGFSNRQQHASSGWWA
ncbi:hypothetical protein OAU85_00480 [Candidatus Poseidoniaceae archaeon]|nr:hypothetical protein [Candidatus Poseidoniaceae archaeon]